VPAYANPYVQRGTAIATFVNGRYPQTGREQNSAIFLKYHPDQGGMVILDQFPKDAEGNPHPAQRRMIYNDSTRPREDNAGAYSVITTCDE
jgi:hypothetical protein